MSNELEHGRETEGGGYPSPEVCAAEATISSEHGGKEAAESALERDLRQALLPLALPLGFSERLVAECFPEGRLGGQLGERPGAERVVPRARAFLLNFPHRRWVGAAFAATLLAGVFATEGAREHRTRERRQATVNQQFEAASRITDQALEHTREQLARAGALRGE